LVLGATYAAHHAASRRAAPYRSPQLARDSGWRRSTGLAPAER